MSVSSNDSLKIRSRDAFWWTPPLSDFSPLIIPPKSPSKKKNKKEKPYLVNYSVTF